MINQIFLLASPIQFVFFLFYLSRFLLKVAIKFIANDDFPADESKWSEVAGTDIFWFIL